jgi:hypothetical protein
VGALPPHPRSLALKGIWRGREKKGRAQKPCPSVIPRCGAQVALQQSLTLRADKTNIPRFNKIYLKELDTGQKLRHERKNLSHHHYWKKQVLLRIPALYPHPAKKKIVVDKRFKHGHPP